MIEVQIDASQVLGDVRHQGKRPTCLAFTASDLNAAANDTAHLSVEYLCHHAARQMPQWSTDSGFTIDAILMAANGPGQPIEELYPYGHADLAAPLQQPPANLSPLYCSPSQRRGLAVQEVFDELEARRIAGVVIAVTRSLFRPVNGVIDDDPMILPDQYHAMVAVGVGRHKTTNESHLLLRNSWGPQWGANGHAWVSRSHLNLHLVEGMTF